MTNSKELIKAVFSQKKPPRIPFIPYVGAYAAKVTQISTREMFSNAVVLSKALMETQRLFGYDAITNIFDGTLAAEACGCQLVWEGHDALPKVASHPLSEGSETSVIDLADIEKKGRLPVVFEATKIIAHLLGKEVGLFGVLCGPLTLACDLGGEGLLQEIRQQTPRALAIINLAGKVLVKLARSYCESSVDGIILADDRLAQLEPSHYSLIHSNLKPLQNILRFFNTRSLLAVRRCTREQQKALAKVPVDGVAFYAALGPEKSEQDLKTPSSLALAIPLSTLEGPRDLLENELREILQQRITRGLFLTGEWEITLATPPENLHLIRELLKVLQP